MKEETIINFINSYELSELEKMMILYDYVKAYFGVKNEFKNNDSESCARYYKQLLEKVNIKSKILTFQNKTNIHNINIVNINDDNYGIYGDFCFDPSLDNNLEYYKNYNGFLMYSDDKLTSPKKLNKRIGAKTFLKLYLNVKELEKMFNPNLDIDLKSVIETVLLSNLDTSETLNFSLNALSDDDIDLDIDEFINDEYISQLIDSRLTDVDKVYLKLLGDNPGNKKGTPVGEMLIYTKYYFKKYANQLKLVRVLNNVKNGYR